MLTLFTCYLGNFFVGPPTVIAPGQLIVCFGDNGQTYGFFVVLAQVATTGKEAAANIAKAFSLDAINSILQKSGLPTAKVRRRADTDES